MNGFAARWNPEACVVYRGWDSPGLFALAVLGLTSLFLSLSAVMLFLAPSLYDTYDLWFGTDIPRHIAWATDPTFVFRSHLHPLSFLLYRTLGTLLALLHVRGHTAIYLACAFPPALLASVAILTAARIVPPERRLLGILGCLTLGSVLIFAPIPESHTLGGAALLLEGGAVFWALQARSREADAAGFAHVAVLWSAAAAGMAPTNALPGLVLLLPLWQIRAGRRAFLRRLGLAALVIFLLEVAVYIFQARNPDVGGSNNLAVETTWLAWPTWRSCWESLASLFLHLFGVPPVHLTIHGSPSPDHPPYPLVYPRQHPSLIQCAAAACWCLGLRLGWNQASRISRILTSNCLTALIGLAAFSAVYDTYEAYMDSAHVWPLLLLPTLLFFREAPSLQSAPALLMTASVLLSALQTCLSFPHAYFLLTRF